MTGPPAHWGGVLDRRRSAYNTLLRAAAAAGADRDLLLAALREVGEVVDGLQAPDEVADVFVDAAVTLVKARRWSGTGVERWALLTLVPQLDRWLAGDPSATVAVAVNGSHAVARSGDVGSWVRRLLAARPALPATPAALRAAGCVAAWRSGVVRLRCAALSAVDVLPEAALAALVDLPEQEVRAALARHAGDPWWWPGSARDEVSVIVRHGGFRGLGGPWVRLPRVVAGDGLRWLVETPATAGEGAADRWALVCDVHGGTVRRWPDTLAPPSVRERPVIRGSRVELAGRTGTLPWDDDITGAAASGRVAVLSRAGSYAVDVLVAPEVAG